MARGKSPSVHRSPNSNSEIWKCFVIDLHFEPLVSADVPCRELRDEPKERLRGRLPGVLHLSELSLHLSLGGIVG